MAKRTNNIERRKKWPPQVLILAMAISMAQFFGMWYIYLVMTPETNDLRWTPLILQLLLNFCFAYLLISMSFRAFHLSRMVNAAHQTLQEEKRQKRFAEAHFRLSKERTEAEIKAKTEYMTNLSHELRTPMNAIVGFSELLLHESLTEEQQDYIRTVHANSKHLLGLINNVLDLSKIESGQLGLVPERLLLVTFINDIDRIIRPSIEAKGLRFEVNLGDDLPKEIIVSGVHLRQCLINLIGNAVKFTESGSITLRLQNKSNSIQFEISDTGIGISEENFEKIFEPFIQADKTTSHTFGGTGLGLAITKKLIELMDGTITVQSVEGQGTTFTLYLPCENPVKINA